MAGGEHARDSGIWLVTYKKASGKPRVTWDEIVDEALCFGWIDSRPGTVDAELSKLWLAPRQRGSGWSRLNKERIERLEAVGLIEESGRRVIEAARADGSWAVLDEVEDGIVPADLRQALAKAPPAEAEWESFSLSARKGILQWIAGAKRPETRARRVTETVELASRGLKANQWPRQG
ncbi:MAG: YdeI/OmpD-associated family protein [Thermoleophilia bacterium]|nr:YdeI/OmpD-associated family protein [Thermoleophilia bacterium]